MYHSYSTFAFQNLLPIRSTSTDMCQLPIASAFALYIIKRQLLVLLTSLFAAEHMYSYTRQ